MSVTTPTSTTLSISHLLIADLPLCEPFGIAFHTEKCIPGEFHVETFVRNWTQFMESGIGTILGLWRGETLIGGLGGIVVADLTSGEMTVNELFWYVQPDARHGTWPIRLIKELKIWGSAHGATRLRMVHILMPNESASTVKLAHVYRQLGLRPIEVAYDGEI